ncbi:MAG: site-specific DNA-methyltransferase [Bacteroidaceae bacterium]|nr:site-specific DNA-methyltransferase [Bacteroidaceae bacterium]MBR6649682.1 site-specific DNA-methyltransferase [Bacteroidaceae bacterium]
MDKEKLIDKIKNLQGLTNDEKADLLGLLRSFKKYGLVWEEKLEEVEERLREEIPVLTEVKERAIISDSADAPNHILIEGDNLEALTTLSYTHERAIDVIYIDPPYNTGNKDFVYNDKFVDAEDEYRHSKWLSFMSKRLRIAKRLLSDKGVIFISIDDNEQAQLKLLCDEIFGIENFISIFPRLTKKAGKTTNVVATNHDYILVYGKPTKFNQLTHSDPAFKLKDEFVAERGCYKLSQTLDYDTLGYVNSLDYPIVINNETFYAGGVTEQEYNIRKESNPKDGYRWRWSKELLDFGIKEGFVVVKKSRNGKRIYTKTYKYASIKRNQNKYFIEIEERTNIIPSIFFLDNLFSNDNARKDLDKIFDEKTFNYPKPMSLLKMIQWISTNKDSIILDFFAGSGTTLHATMRLNAEDGGNRKCILVTNNENGICENVTYLRNKKVIEGYTTPKGEEVAGLTNNTLRYYRTEFLPRERSPRNMRALVSLATDLLCIKEDLYTEQKMFGKYPTHPKLMRYFANDKKHMLILYKEEAVFDIVEEIKNIEFNGKLKIYIFTPGRYPFSDDFFEVQDKVELVALPAAIYDAYTRVLPKRKEKYLTPEKEGETAPLTLFNDNEEGEE